MPSSAPTTAPYKVMKLSRTKYELWKIARDAGFTPREVSSTYNAGTYTISIEKVLPNAIALCYTEQESPEAIISSLRKLHALGVQPLDISNTDVHFTV